MTNMACDERAVAPAKRPRAFILQEPFRMVDGQMVSVMNFAKAAEFGDPVVCLPSEQVALSPYPTKERLKEVFADFTDDDFIVAVGDPTLIFLAGMVISDLNRGRCNMLKYDKYTKRYIKIEFNLHQRLGSQ